MDYAKEYKHGNLVYNRYRKDRVIKHLAKALFFSVFLSIAGRATIGLVHGFETGFFDVLFVGVFLNSLLIICLPFVLYGVVEPYKQYLMVGYWVIDQHLKEGVTKDEDFVDSDVQPLLDSTKTYIELSPYERGLLKQALLKGLVFVTDIFDEETISLAGRYEVATPYDMDVLLAESEKYVVFNNNQNKE